MLKSSYALMLASWLLCFAALQAVADESETETEKKSSAIPEATQFVSQHSARTNGQKIAYTAVAGETYLRDIEGKPTASIFSFAYLSKNDDQNRPVTFIWNGGPGSASVWLHMSGAAPHYVDVPSDASHAGPPPYPLKASANSLLDVTDLVFIDPVGTGFSRALGETDKTTFWGTKPDAHSMANFIRTWITDNNRWNSPLFILGESYGTTRAAYVANILQGEMDINLNGILFVSQALDYQGSSPYVRDNIISYITYVPTMAATAFYHNKVTTDVDQPTFVEQARQFASQELLPALFLGNRLDTQKRAQLAKKLAYFTGLSTQYIEQVNLRVDAFRFAKQLMRDSGRAVGLLDGRYTADEIDDVEASVERDASSDAIAPAFLGALQAHMRGNLNVNWDRAYLSPSDPELSDNWSYAPSADAKGWEPTYVTTAHHLSEALHINPHLKVLVASGYYDLITPFFDAEFTLNRHDIAADKIEYKYYQGGHMMYVNGEAREQWLNDSRVFIQQQIKR